MDNEIFLEAKNLSFGYLKRPLTLKDINFSVLNGEKVLLLSSREMGKTTFLSVVSSFESNYQGEILLKGKELKSINDAEKNFSLLPNNPVFFENKTILLNVNYLLSVNKMQNYNEEKLNSYLKTKNFSKKSNVKIKALTVCEKRILSILRSLLKNPDCIFIDDMFALLDEEDKEKIKYLYIEELAKRDTNVFFAFGDTTYKNCKDVINKLHISKVLYLFDATMVEFSSINDFENNIVNANQMLFFDKKNYIKGDILLKDGNYYFEKDSEIIKLDKLNDDILCKIVNLNLENYDAEEVTVYFNENEIDDFQLIKFQDLLNLKKVMIFSVLDGSRIV